MIKNLFIIIFILTVNLTFGQVKCVVSDSTKRQLFIKALENYSTSPNFIVFKAVTINSNEPREMCQLGGYFINKTLGNNSAKILDWDKQIIQFTSFIIADTTFYEKYDSTLNAVTEKKYIKKIEILPFDSIKYNDLESKFGNILIENAKQG